MVELKTRISG